MATRNYLNTVSPTSLSTPATGSATTLNVASTAGFPSVPFTIGVDRGTPDEEAMLVTAITATTMTVVRGYDSSTATSHEATASVEHCVIALDYREANRHIEDANRDDHPQYLNLARMQDYLPRVYTGNSQKSASPFTASYKEVNRVQVPAAPFPRLVQVTATLAVALGAGHQLHTLAIRHNNVTIGAGTAYSNTGLVGTIPATTGWVSLGANTVATYISAINRATGSGGAAETSPNLNVITAIAVPNF